MEHPLVIEAKSIWQDKHRYVDAERRYEEQKAGITSSNNQKGRSNATQSSIVAEIENARKFIKQTLADADSVSQSCTNESVVMDIKNLKDAVAEIQQSLQGLNEVVNGIKAMLPATQQQQSKVAPAAAAPAKKAESDDDEEEDVDDIDLFDSDEEDEETKKIREERLKKYAEKKSKKPALIAKSNIILEVKPWDDETNMKELEKCVRSVATDGLLWGSSSLVPVGYGIMKLKISCVVEDDKVGTDFLEEEIGKFDDHVQSVDIVAFNKI